MVEHRPEIFVAVDGKCARLSRRNLKGDRLAGPHTLFDRETSRWALDGKKCGVIVVAPVSVSSTGFPASIIELSRVIVGCCTSSAGIEITIGRPDSEGAAT
jgi:hypothetical protein